MVKGYTVRRTWLRRLLKIHTLALSVSLGVYFTLAFVDPGLLSYDLRQKFHALASDTIAVTARVLGPPVVPVVSATAACNGTTGVLSVTLDWADDPNSYTFDITRNTLPLVSGLANSAYSDTTILVATAYQYEVTAHGPMGAGFATSLPVTVTTPNECLITLAAPAVTVVSFAGRNVDSFNGTFRTRERQPTFTGTTSMPGATMVVSIGSNFLSTFPANGAGYWEWQPPERVAFGEHNFTITATDPHDGARQATATLHFEITNSAASGGSASNAKVLVTPSTSEMPQVALFQFIFAVENKDAAVLQGEALSVVTTLQGLPGKYTHITVPIRYTLLDENRNIISSDTHDTYITEGAVIHTSLAIPLYLQPGEYTAQAEILFDGLDVSRLASFSVRALPLIELSSGATISYADIVRNLGWVTFLFLTFFFLWIFLFIREFRLYLQGDREITEYDLGRAGYFRK